MCVGGGAPSTPAPDPAVAEQQAEAKAQETTKAKTRRQEALEQRLTSMRGGRGRRSLLTSSRGGMGFYNEYLK